MNLSILPLAELRALDLKIKREIMRRQGQDLAQARQQIAAIAQQAGIALKDLLKMAGKSPKKPVNSMKGKKIPARFQHPDHAGLTWTGRGVRPQWVTAWLNQGGTLDQLRIQA